PPESSPPRGPGRREPDLLRADGQDLARCEDGRPEGPRGQDLHQHLTANRAAPGLDTRFCWTELCTSESEKAVRFYARLLGWESVPQPVSTRSGQTIDYTLFSLRGRNVGGMYPMVAVQRRQGMRPHWLSYAFVEDAASCATRATKLGAVLLAGPLNVFDLGRLCILRDPTGACFGAWQSMRLDSTFQTRNEPGFAAWFEHVSENVRQAADFYGSLF